MCKVSVVVPVYNVERWLPACLDSVLGQTLRDLEVICIDDASPDGCPAILDAYAEADSRVRVIHLAENHRQGYGRNRGMEAARGEYIYLLDSDDMILPEALEELALLADREQLDAVFFDSQEIFERPEALVGAPSYSACRSGTYADHALPGLELYKAFIRQKDWNVFVQRQFWRTSFLRENGLLFPEGGIEHEDEFFSFAATLLARRARCIDRPYFLYRRREDSVMTRPRLPRDFWGYLVNYCLMADFVTTHGFSGPEIQRNLDSMYEMMHQLLPVFLAQEDIEPWFADQPQLRPVYSLFCTAQQFTQAEEERNAAIWVPLGQPSAVWIYGAGKMAKAAYRRLCRAGYMVAGFAVTSPEGNPAALYGRPVVPLDSFRPKDGEAVVVAVSSSLHGQISALLRERGIRHWLYANSQLTEGF